MSHLRIRETTKKDKKGKIKKRYQMIINTYKNGRRFYKAETFNSEKEAKAWERKTLRGIDEGTITKESLKRRRLSDAIEKYISLVLPHKPRNAKNVIHHLNWWNKQIGRLALSDITAPMVAECRDRLLSEPSKNGGQRTNTTVIRYLASLSIVLEYCMKEWHWITHNAVRSIRKPPLGKSKTRFFTLEEIDTIQGLAAKSDSPHLLGIILIALHTGMRKGEILSLQWAHIDLKNKEILLSRSKNGEPRDIPMTDPVYDLLSKLSLTAHDSEDLLFPSPFNSRKSVDIRSAWERILRQGSIEGATFHTIRHTTCSLLASLGIPSILIARIVGHKDSRTTDIYTHAFKQSQHEAIKKLGSTLPQSHS